jgi:hypothetical protein
MIGKYGKFEGNRLNKYGGHLGTTFGKYGKRWETHEKLLVYWDDICCKNVLLRIAEIIIGMMIEI